MFELGELASDELAALADNGAIGDLAGLLSADPKVIDVADSGGMLAPGDSITVDVSANDGARQVSVASMLIHTNNGFLALNGVEAPRDNKLYAMKNSLFPSYR